MHYIFCLVFICSVKEKSTKKRQTPAMYFFSDHLFILDGDNIFSANLGNLHGTAARCSRMWIYWWTLPSSSTG